MPGLAAEVGRQQFAGAVGDGKLEAVRSSLPNLVVADDDVGFLGEQQAERVDVRRADGGPFAVDDGDLGVHEALFVFEDADAGREGCGIKRLRRIAQQMVVGLALEQHRDANTRAGRRRRARGRSARRAGNRRWRSGFRSVRPIDGVEVGVQDVVAVADVVADQEGGGLLAGRSQQGEALAGRAGSAA
jgi:hypothetical protein